MHHTMDFIASLWQGSSPIRTRFIDGRSTPARTTSAKRSQGTSTSLPQGPFGEVANSKEVIDVRQSTTVRTKHIERHAAPRGDQSFLKPLVRATSHPIRTSTAHFDRSPNEGRLHPASTRAAHRQELPPRLQSGLARLERSIRDVLLLAPEAATLPGRREGAHPPRAGLRQLGAELRGRPASSATSQASPVSSYRVVAQRKNDQQHGGRTRSPRRDPLLPPPLDRWTKAHAPLEVPNPTSALDDALPTPVDAPV